MTAALAPLLAVMLVAAPARVAQTRAAHLGVRLGDDQAARIGAAVVVAHWVSDVPESLILAMIEVESTYDARAVSSARCRGLTQLAPSTADEIARWLGWPRADLRRISHQVVLGSLYLAALGPVWRRALSAYNMGPTGWARAGHPTTAYARKVLRRRDQIRAMLSPRRRSA